MADVSGLSGYDVHSRRNHVGQAHSMQAHSLRADSEAMSYLMFNTRENCSMIEDHVISGGEHVLKRPRPMREVEANFFSDRAQVGSQIRSEL